MYFMKNIPRIFIPDELKTGITIPVSRETSHYLTRVMRTHDCLVFGDGHEYVAKLSDDGKSIYVGDATSHTDPSGNITLMFAPIKRTDDLINMATQMGVACFQPVITDRVTAHHVNWDRMRKIMIEACEQSNRNSVPEILAPVKFTDLDLTNLVFADERVAYGHDTNKIPTGTDKILVGPEGGFSDAEFAKLDSVGACGISLGKTILRAEVAAVIAINNLQVNK